MNAEVVGLALTESEFQQLDYPALCDDCDVLTQFLAAHLLTMTLEARRATISTLEGQLSTNGMDALKSTLRTLHASRPHYGELRMGRSGS